MLTAGHGRFGCRGASQSRRVRAPQVGWARRASQRSSATSALIRCGQSCGARLRSRSAARPPASIRSSHLEPVFRLTP